MLALEKEKGGKSEHVGVTTSTSDSVKLKVKDFQ